MYIRKTYKVKGHMYVREYTKRSYGAPSQTRAQRLKETPKAMKLYNHQKRAEKLQLLILNNFDKGYHVILDYPVNEKPETYEQAEDNLRKALYKTSRRLKKKDIRFKYLGVTERGKKAAALHHHLIIEGRPEILGELIEVWGQHIKIMTMYEDGEYKDLADYLIKIETKEEQTKGRSKYHRSRNLKDPVERTSIKVGPIPREPEVPENYELVKDSVKSGYNEIIGIRYQRYMLRQTGSRPPEQKPRGFLDKLKKIFRRRP